MCPRCRQDAPIVYRGLAAYCTACGASRVPLTASSINLAGRPSQIGGALGRALGWLILVSGGVTAIILLAILQYAFPDGMIGYAVGGSVAAIALTLSVWLLRQGKALTRGGDTTEKTAKIAAIYSMASLRGGVVRAAEVAASLRIDPVHADALLTELAKTRPECVTLEFDEDGQVYYLVKGAEPLRVRVQAAASGAPAAIAEDDAEVARSRGARR